MSKCHVNTEFLTAQGRGYVDLFRKFPLKVLPVSARDCMLLIFSVLDAVKQTKVIDAIEKDEQTGFLNRGGVELLRKAQQSQRKIGSDELIDD